MSRSSSLLQKVIVNKESKEEKAKLDLNKLHILELKFLDMQTNEKVLVRDPVRKRTSILVPPKEFTIQYLPNLPEFTK